MWEDFKSHAKYISCQVMYMCQDKGGCREDPLATRVMERIGNVTGAATTNFEDFQLLQYEKGQFYKTHHDYIRELYGLLLFFLLSLSLPAFFNPGCTHPYGARRSHPTQMERSSHSFSVSPLTLLPHAMVIYAPLRAL